MSKSPRRVRRSPASRQVGASEPREESDSARSRAQSALGNRGLRRWLLDRQPSHLSSPQTAAASRLEEDGSSRDPGERQADVIGGRIAADLGDTEPVGTGPLPPDVRAVAEGHLGVDLTGARLRADPEANGRAHDLAAQAVTEGGTVSFAKGRLSTSSMAGRSLLGHELTHVAQQAAHGPMAPSVQRKPEPSTYQKLKEAAYGKVIRGVVTLRAAYFKTLRSAANLLPAGLRGAAHAMLDIMNDVAQIVHNFLFYVVGVIVGLGEGAVGMITGLIQLAATILRYLKEIAEAIFAHPANLQEHWAETKAFLSNLGPGLKQIFDEWIEKFEGETQERQSAMIGELVGQVVVFVVTFEVAAAKLGNVGKVTIPLRALEPAEQLVTAGANVGVKTAGGAEAITINMAKAGPHIAAAGTTGAATEQLAEKANEAQKGPKPAESKPPEAKPKAPQETFPAEKAAGFTEGQLLAIEKFVGRNFNKIEQYNFKKLWEGATNPNHLKTTQANTNMSKGAKAQIRGYFDATRDKFWKAVGEDPVARQVIEDAGFKFDKPGTAPKMARPDGKTLSLDVDHQIRLTDNPSKALDPDNLRLILPRENRVVLEQIRKQDPFQKVP